MCIDCQGGGFDESPVKLSEKLKQSIHELKTGRNRTDRPMKPKKVLLTVENTRGEGGFEFTLEKYNENGIVGRYVKHSLYTGKVFIPYHRVYIIEEIEDEV